jgi:hypothetical protein
MPKTSKSKVHVLETSSVVIEAAKSHENLTLVQKKKQAQEPIYLDRM